MEEKYRYLNLQEQVGKNKHDIEELKNIKFNLERAGVQVVGEEASASDLPDPITYEGNFGDAYLIGENPPYDMYIYTQPSAGETNNKWFNIGQFPAVGPRGERGLKGDQGEKGDSARWRFGLTNPAVLDTDKEGDGFLNTSTGMVFEFNGEKWIAIGSIRGPKGVPGREGPQGPIGPQGLRGYQGERGPAGVVIEIIGVLNSSGSLPDPDTVQRNAGFIIDDGVDRDLYIIVEDENQDLIWYNAGPFTGTPGAAGGFGLISATVTPISPGETPSVGVETSGQNDALNIAFLFRLPVGAELSNESSDTPSETKGYTQKVINERSFRRVITELSDIMSGSNTPVSTASIIAAIYEMEGAQFAIIEHTESAPRITDAPSENGSLVVICGDNHDMYEEARFVDISYNVYIYAGEDANSHAIWHRLITSADGDSIGVPDGGLEGQILAKKSDDPYDTEWENVPNAPNGVPSGGTQGQLLAKKTGANYDGEWIDPPTPVPDGGTTGQMLVKQSNADGDAAWATPPVGIPSGGTTGQVLEKKSGTNFDVEWKTRHDVPSGGTAGQVLQKASGSDYDTEWATPSSGGGGGSGVNIIGENLLINPDFAINQRGVATTSTVLNANKYTADRWYGKSGATVQATSPFNLTDGRIEQYIDVFINKRWSKYFICGVHYNSSIPSSGTPSVKLGYLNTTITELTPINNSPITITVGAITQVVNIYENPFTTTAHRLVFGIEASGYVNLLEAFCYCCDSYDNTAITTARFPVIVNPNVELEKCKYYFERWYDNSQHEGNFFLKRQSSYVYGTIIRDISNKRIVPTVTSTYFDGYYGPFTDFDGTRQSVSVNTFDVVSSSTYKTGSGRVLIVNIKSRSTQQTTTTATSKSIAITALIDAEIYP